MGPLPIVAAAGFAQIAAAEPDSLRERLRAVTTNAPRRINRLSELGLIGAHRCVGGRELASDTSVVVAATTGCISDSVRLLRAAGHRRPMMPMDFINVSSNMTGFHLASSLRLHSSNQVVASADLAWEAAIEIAMLGSPRFLVGAIEECAWPLDEHRERLGLAGAMPILESSQWLWIDCDAPAPIASLDWVKRFRDDVELSRYFAASTWVNGTEISVHNADPKIVQRLTGLNVPDAPTPVAHSGIASAAACIAAVTRGARSFLSICGSRGGWCVTSITST